LDNASLAPKDGAEFGRSLADILWMLAAGPRRDLRQRLGRKFDTGAAPPEREHESLDLPFDQNGAAAGKEGSFVVDVEGFEGPLDLLLDLARRQKVDLSKISVLALAEQYLEFIAATRRLRLELAADYLVMAAWLAYLKSRLLLPQAAKGAEPEGAELAEILQLRLRRLDAIRAAAEALVNRPRLGRDMFLRGQPEASLGTGAPQWRASIYELLSAYAHRRQKQALKSHPRVTLKQRFVWSLADARIELEKLAGRALDWTVLDTYLVAFCTTPEVRRTVRASTLSASLEMAREGAISIRQDKPFAPLWIKRKAPQAEILALVRG
jgi:segregation and condensation protein A